jgi:hypothetical protein
MCRNDTNVPAVNIKEARKCFTIFLIPSVIGIVDQKSFNQNEFQSWSVTYDYTLSLYQKSSQYLKS